MGAPRLGAGDLGLAVGAAELEDGGDGVRQLVQPHTVVQHQLRRTSGTRHSRQAITLMTIEPIAKASWSTLAAT